MARLIDFADYLNGKKEKAHILENLDYVATREGVMLNDEAAMKFVQPLNAATASYKVTDRQFDLIRELLEKSPELKESISYENLQKHTNMYTASVFIAESMDRLFAKRADNAIYLKYISERPGVQKRENMEHGLFDTNGAADINKYRNELLQYDGNVWRHILSIRREDAIMCEYETQEAWRDLVNNHIYDHAKKMGIDRDQLRWVAAFHDEGYHPHIHLIMWSANGEGFQDKEALYQFRKALTKDIFDNEIWLREQYKAQIRDDFEQAFEMSFQKQMDQAIRSSKENLKHLGKQMVQLANELPDRRVQVYGYLSPQLKSQVTNIIKTVLECPNVHLLMDKYLESHRILASVYMKDGSDVMNQYLERSMMKILDPQKGDRKKLQNFILKAANEMKLAERQRKMLLSYQMMNVENKLQDHQWQNVNPELGKALIKTQMALGKDPTVIVEHTTPYFPKRETALEAYLDCKYNSEISKEEIRMIEKNFNESLPSAFQPSMNETQVMHCALRIFQQVLMEMEDSKIRADKEAHRLFVAHRLDERNMRLQRAKS